MPDELLFDAASHTYTLGGRRLVSVTQVLEATGICDYSHLPLAVREKAKERGSTVHVLTHYDDENDLEESSVQPELMGYIQAWRAARAWLATLGFAKPSKIEYRGHHPYGFAGTLDREFEKGQEALLVDIKTGEMPEWVRVQLAAYAAILSKEGMSPYRRMGIQLNADGTFVPREFPVKELRSDFDDFLAAHRVCILKAKNR